MFRLGLEQTDDMTIYDHVLILFVSLNISDVVGYVGLCWSYFLCLLNNNNAMIDLLYNHSSMLLYNAIHNTIYKTAVPLPCDPTPPATFAGALVTKNVHFPNSRHLRLNLSKSHISPNGIPHSARIC